MDTSTLKFPGYRYKSLTLNIPNLTTDYNICENNISEFPDWNSNWNERDYWNICVIKNLTHEISIKFHSIDYDSIPISLNDIPAIFEPFNFRDVFITNISGYLATFDIQFYNNRGISPPPLKPTNFTGTRTSQTLASFSFTDNAINEDYYKVERSNISATSGFNQIFTFNQPSNPQIMDSRTLTFKDTTAQAGHSYWYRIRAYNSTGGNSPYSEVVFIPIFI